jgi:hypothetical protein
MSKDKAEDSYTPEETIARAEAALKRILATPPKPHSAMKIGKRKAKASQKASLAGKGGKNKRPCG